MKKNNTQNRYEYLATQWRSKNITRSEEEELFNWLNAGDDNLLKVPVLFAKSEEELRSAMYEQITELLKSERPIRRIRRWPRIAGVAAAVVAVTLTTWLYFGSDYVGSSSPSLKSAATRDSNDITPAKNAATLTLTNGKTIELSDTKTGVMIDAGKFTYTDESPIALAFENETAIPKTEIVRNIDISTPRGGTYQVVLPDGSRVWLNAASTIKFPLTFKGAAQRIVELTGEAYFEVQKSPNIPFIVKSNGQEAMVLGTEFNINSYIDEDKVTTTLVTGSLKVNSDKGKSILLVPGEETLLSPRGLERKSADIEMATAWREGTFYFNKTSFDDMMRQVSRWYNVDVVYLTKKIPDVRFNGEIKRNVTLQTVLTYIQDVGVNLSVEGRTIYIE